MEKFSDILKEFDVQNKKGFDFHEVYSTLGKLSDAIKANPVYVYECIAMCLVPNVQNNAWGTYYGSQMKGQDSEGNILEFPSLQSITSDAIDYWYNRSKNVVNPMLKARYAGLVWDFTRKVPGRKVPSDLYGLYVDSLLEVVSGEYPSHPVITVNVCNRLFELTRNNDTYFSRVKNALISFDNKYSVEKYDKSPRLWGMLLQLIIARPKNFTEQENRDVLCLHEDRLERLLEKLDKDESLFWTIKEQVTLLAEYYQKIKNVTEVIRVLNLLERAFDRVSKGMSGLQRTSNIEMIARIYAHFNLLKERARLLKSIEESGKEAIKEMKPMNFDFSYPPEALKELSDFILAGTSSIEQLQKYCLYFVPNKNEQERQLKDLAKSYPLQYMIPTQMFDENGKPLSVVGSIEKDLEGHLVLLMTRLLQLQSVPLNFVSRALFEKQILSVESIMQLVMLSPIIRVNRYEVIETAVKAYTNGDNLIFCHLIVPQIETMVREFLEQSGRETIRPQKNGKFGYTLRILDDMLRDEAIQQAFNEDIAYYFRITLTDQRGLNIRNSLCHGLVSPMNFGQMAADRLLHIFLLWLQIRSN